MTWYKYWAKTPTGEDVNKIEEASGVTALVAELRRIGLVILHVEETDAPMPTEVDGMHLLARIERALKRSDFPEIIDTSYDGDNNDASLIITVQGEAGPEDWILRSNDIKKLED
jgi:hypothetical protein